MHTPLDLEPIAQAICAERRYRYVGKAGEGAFKQTFHVLLHEGTPQALKVYQPGLSRERTDREIVAMTRCCHPNIGRLSLVDHYSYSGVDHIFSLEEFLSGGTLTSRLSAGPLSRDRVLALGEDLIDAVAHIAFQGLVHRDLKPDNILFREDGVTPVIVDFGIVRDLTLSSLTESWLSRGPGTPLFAPPEQLNNEKALINWRADQFSLGVLLSISAFGFHPFEESGDLPPEIVQHVATRRQSTVRFRAAAQTSRLAALIKMTDPWPIYRFRTASDLADAWRRQS